MQYSVKQKKKKKAKNHHHHRKKNTFSVTNKNIIITVLKTRHFLICFSRNTIICLVYLLSIRKQDNDIGNWGEAVIYFNVELPPCFSRCHCWKVSFLAKRVQLKCELHFLNWFLNFLVLILTDLVYSHISCIFGTGFLHVMTIWIMRYCAIHWKPNKDFRDSCSPVLNNNFSRWFELGISKGLVIMKNTIKKPQRIVIATNNQKKPTK